MLLFDSAEGSRQAIRWGLVSEERARKSLAFFTDPLWRAYTSTYVEGYVLLGKWLEAGEPAEQFVGRPPERLGVDRALARAGRAYAVALLHDGELREARRVAAPQGRDGDGLQPGIGGKAERTVRHEARDRRGAVQLCPARVRLHPQAAQRRRLILGLLVSAPRDWKSLRAAMELMSADASDAEVEASASMLDGARGTDASRAQEAGLEDAASGVVERVRIVRKTVGPDVEILVELVKSVGASAEWTERNTLHIHAKEIRSADLDPERGGRRKCQLAKKDAFAAIVEIDADELEGLGEGVRRLGHRRDPIGR